MDDQAIEIGNWVLIVGPRYNGRRGKVTKMANGTVTVSGDFGGRGFKGRVEREFLPGHVIHLPPDDMDRSENRYGGADVC